MRRNAARSAWALMGVTPVSNIGGGVLEMLRPAAVHGVRPPVLSDFQYPANAILCGVAGLLIARRRPQNVIWVALAGAGLCGGIFGFLAEYTIHSQLVARLPGDQVATWISNWIFPTIPALNVLLLLLFPTGRPLGPRWRLAMLPLVAGVVLLTVGLASMGFLGLPVAMGFAILKSRLSDIDVVITRPLVYGARAGFITAVYVGIVVGIGTLVGSGGQPNLVLSIVATAIVAVAFQPVRQRLQRIANRLVYGQRATPYEGLSHVSQRVAPTYAADEALP